MEQFYKAFHIGGNCIYGTLVVRNIQSESERRIAKAIIACEAGWNYKEADNLVTKHAGEDYSPNDSGSEEAKNRNRAFGKLKLKADGYLHDFSKLWDAYYTLDKRVRALNRG